MLNQRFLIAMLLVTLSLLTNRSSCAQSSQTVPGPGAVVVLPSSAQGVSVRLTPSEPLLGSQCKAGQAVDFHVIEVVRDEAGAILIPANSRVQGYVTEARGPQEFGRAGMLHVTCDYVELPDKRRLPIRFDRTASGENARFLAKSTALIVTSVLTTASAAASLGLAYAGFSSNSSYALGVVGLATVLVLPTYVAVKLYHFFGSAVRGSDAMIHPGDVFVGLVSFPQPAASAPQASGIQKSDSPKEPR